METERQEDHEMKKDATHPKEKHVVGLDPNDTTAAHDIMMDETTLVHKIATNSVVDNVTVTEAAAAIGDVLLYTYEIPMSEYAATTNHIVGAMEDSGLQPLKWKNTWDDPLYKGINSTWMDDTGQKFEVQFHTPESFTMKGQVLHPL